MERSGNIIRPRRALPAFLASCALMSACSNSDSAPISIPPEAVTTTDIKGCEPFRVYAQNRWQPYGTAVREEPDVLSDKVASFAPNEVIAVDGWYDSGEPVYPTNPAPWNSSIWLRVAFDNVEGYVSFAGVRGAPSSPDETGLSDYGGEPALLPAGCELQQP